MSAAPSNMRLVIAASSIGTLIEWYDLFLAIILSRVLSNQLFPGGESTHFLETLAIVGSSYIARPIGGLIFGSMGDRRGRKNSFLISLLLMGGATFLIGCLPTFQQVGWLAPVLLLILRLAQGFALSGEYAGAVIYVSENAPPEKRGFFTGFIQITAALGLVFGLMIVLAVQSLMTPADFQSFGWRLPFLLSALMVWVAYIVRRKLPETPVFSEMQAAGNLSTSPVQEMLSKGENWRKIFHIVFGCNAAQSAMMQSFQFVTLFFLQRTVGLAEKTSLLILAAALLAGIPFYQIAGAWSDRFGRKKIIFSGLLFSLVSLPVSFYLFKTLGNPNNLPAPQEISMGLTLFFIFLTFVNAFAGALMYGPMGAFLVESFPGKTRYTGMAFTQNLGNGVIGGSTPFITEFLKANLVVGAVLSPYIGLIYPMGLAALAVLLMPWLPETAGRKAAPILKRSLSLLILAACLGCTMSSCSLSSAPKPKDAQIPDTTLQYLKPDVQVGLPDNLDSLNIPFNFFKKRDLVVSGDRLDSIVVLKALFPGIFFKDYEYTEGANAVIWTCETCPKLRYESGTMDSTGRPYYEDFPAKWLNFTQCTGALSYTEDSVNKQVFFFNTGTDLPGSGRFVFGALGAAVFEKNEDLWRLDAFSPLVCGEGRYNKAEVPTTVLQYGNQTFFELKGGYAESPGASYIYSGEHLFALRNGRIERLFLDVYAHCRSYDERLMHWESKVEFVPAQHQLPDILLMTSGHFEINDDQDEEQLWRENISWWPGLKAFLGKNVPSKFEMKRQFRYNGQSYKMIKHSYSKV